MNIWVKRSIEIANSHGYLDKLSEIYTPTVEERREIPDNAKHKIKPVSYTHLTLPTN